MPTLHALHYATLQPVAVQINGQAIGPITRIDHPCPDLPFVAPGLIDLQINGHAGHDLNASPLADDALSRLTRSLWPQGVTTFFPTIITNADEVIADNLRAIAAACDRDPAVHA